MRRSTTASLSHSGTIVLDTYHSAMAAISVKKGGE